MAADSSADLGADVKPARQAGPAELALFGVIALITVLLAVALAIRLADANSDPGAGDRKKLLTAGASGAAALLSYDYRTVDRLTATNRPLLTDACAAGYTAQITTIKPEVAKNQVVLSTSVGAAAVQSSGTDRATVLVVVDEKRIGGDRADQNTQLAVSVNLVRSGKRWLVDDLLPAGSSPVAGAKHCA